MANQLIKLLYVASCKAKASGVICYYPLEEQSVGKILLDLIFLKSRELGYLIKICQSMALFFPLAFFYLFQI